MGITGLIPFLEKASRKANVGEFSGCTVAIDTYCWLHKGAFACADKLARGEDTDVYIKYCLKYVTMLLSKNIKPILVFDGRHLAAKALTESKRRESRDISKKRAAELLSLGKMDEARTYMRRCVDVTHKMALSLIKECRKRNVDCIVAPYEADAQLAYLNIKNIAQLVITEDSDLILFGCTKVLFKMDLEGSGTLVETVKLPLVMRCPIEHYSFDRFRQMCIMSGCDYLPSLPGIGLAKARQFILASQDPNIANALRKLPSYFNRSNLTVTDEYRESFLKAEATFKHQYVYDPITREMVRLTPPDDENIETALCVNAGELLDPKTAFQLALGNIDPFTLKPMDDWHPDHAKTMLVKPKSENWTDNPVAPHPSIWSEEFTKYLEKDCPWRKNVERPDPIIAAPVTRPRKKVVNMVPKYVPETQDESLTIDNLSSMYCIEPAEKKRKTDYDNNDISDLIQSAINEPASDEIVRECKKSPILENKERSFKKSLKNGRLSKFTMTVLDTRNVVESKFFSTTPGAVAATKEPNSDSDVVEKGRNPFKIRSISEINQTVVVSQELNNAVLDSQSLEADYLPSSQKENSSVKCRSPILDSSIRLNNSNDLTEDSVIENTYPLERLVTPVDSQLSFGASQPDAIPWYPVTSSQPVWTSGPKKSTCRVPGLKRTTSLPANQSLLARFGFQKKPVMKR